MKVDLKLLGFQLRTRVISGWHIIYYRQQNYHLCKDAADCASVQLIMVKHTHYRFCMDESTHHALIPMW